MALSVALVLACAGTGGGPDSPASTAPTPIAGGSHAPLPGWLGFVDPAGGAVIVPWAEDFSSAAADTPLDMLVAGGRSEGRFDRVAQSAWPCDAAERASARLLAPDVPSNVVWVLPTTEDVDGMIFPFEPAGEPSAASRRWTAGAVSASIDVFDEQSALLAIRQDGPPIGEISFDPAGADLTADAPTGVPIPVATLRIGPTFYLVTQRDEGGQRAYRVHKLGPDLPVVAEASLDGC